MKIVRQATIKVVVSTLRKSSLIVTANGISQKWRPNPSFSTSTLWSDQVHSGQTSDRRLTKKEDDPINQGTHLSIP